MPAPDYSILLYVIYRLTHAELTHWLEGVGKVSIHSLLYLRICKSISFKLYVKRREPNSNWIT